MPRNFVVCAASSLEFAALQKISLEKNFQISFIELGIGSIASAVGAAELARQFSGKNVLFLGSCGAYDMRSLPLCSIVSPSSVAWEDLGLRNSLSYKVKGTEPELIFKGSQNCTVMTLPSSRVVCAPTITSSVQPFLVKEAKQVVENIELYGVYFVLKKWASTFTPLLVVTNQVGPDSHLQWLSNQERAYQTLADFACDFITRG